MPAAGPLPGVLRASLLTDLAQWSAAVTQAPMDKHASQVTALVDQLTAALDLAVPPQAAPSADLEQSVLDLHYVWEFFRTKLALRYVPWYRDSLAVADDLAWAAFRPVRDAAERQGHVSFREPPLVFPSRRTVPFSLTRGEDYSGLLPAGGGRWTESADAVAECLVVPVISLPWHRLNEPAAVLSVAHEVGHVIAHDLDLLPVLHDHLNGSMTDQLHPEWLEEMFADVFATIVCGAATGTALTSAGPMTEAPEYPPADIRLRLIATTAQRRGGAAVSDITGGDDTEGDVGTALAADLQSVVTAIVDDDLGLGTGLGSLFSTVDTAELVDDVVSLTRGRDPAAPDVRALLAAATLATASPELTQRVHTHATALREVGRRTRIHHEAEQDRTTRAAERLAAAITRR